MQTQAKENLSLNKIFQCSETIILRDNNISDYKKTLQDFANKKEIKRNTELENIVLSALSSFDSGYSVSINSTAKLTYTLCNSELSNQEYIEALNVYFQSENNNYHYGVPSIVKEQLTATRIDALGILSDSNPVKQLLNINVNLPTLVLAKSSFCQTPIQSSRYYVIAKDENLIYLFFVQFTDMETQPLLSKMGKNLSSTVQTIKANLHCSN